MVLLMRRRTPLPLLAVLLLLPAALHAEAEPAAAEGSGETAKVILGAQLPARTPLGSGWQTWGSAALHGVGWSDPAIDNEGSRSGRTQWFDSRLLGGGAWAGESVRFELELEALSGQLAGETTEVGTALDADAFRDPRDTTFGRTALGVRRAAMTWKSPVGQLAVGQQVASFGLGLLANDGAGQGNVFGDARGGSIVERIAFGTSPFRESEAALLRGLVLYAAGDLVYQDENASLPDGDEAWAVSGGARLEADGLQFAVAQSGRWQTDRRDERYPADRRTEVEAATTSIFARVRLWRDAEQTAQLTFESEAAYTTGRSDRAYLDETFEEGADLSSLGGVARIRYDSDGARLSAVLEAGYASGDNDPRDATARQFTFHSDYNVGLILFDHYLPMLTGRSVDRIANPDLIAVAPGSTRFTINQGAVQNAAYLYPTVRVRPLEALDLRVGWLVAQAAGDLIDPYLSGLSAGYNTTWGGQSPGSRALGQEFDASAAWTLRPTAEMAVRVGAEGGVLLPGDGLKGLGRDDAEAAWLARGTVAVNW